MLLNERQLSILRVLGAVGAIERHPDWSGMSLRALRRRGYIEHGHERVEIRWWGWRAQCEAETVTHRFLWRITPAGRAILEPQR